jgi:predicted tellurium resistance membrane protein TerC
MNPQRRLIEVTDAGLSGIGMVMVIQLLQVPTLDTPLYVSLHAFAAAIPMLTAHFVIHLLRPNFYLVYTALYEPFLRWVGFALALVGIGAIFWHFPSSVTFIFILASIFSASTLIHWSSRR